MLYLTNVGHDMNFDAVSAALPRGVMARTAGAHAAGPGSTPDMGCGF